MAWGVQSGARMKFRWSPAIAQPSVCEDLCQQLKISALLAQCLVNRNLNLAQNISCFLEPRLKNLSDPFVLPGMAAAVDRLLQARAQAELVVIFGDYDVDGVTATAVLFEFLRDLGWRVEFYLPHRLDEGYGLTADSVERCLSKAAARLLIAVDCGSSASSCIERLRQQGVDVIVVDHHQVSDPAPQALALVNPLLCPVGDMAPLCSVGVAFKLAHALVKRARQADLEPIASFDVRPLLDLVALGTIADLVPLVGENRILVSCGLERLNRTTRPGLIGLMRVSRCARPIGVYEVGFQLGPRLNAAGRMETAEESLRLLLSRDVPEAVTRAQKLEQHNADRQKLEREISDQVIRQVQGRFVPEKDYVIVEGDTPWHVGIVGIVAARVLRQFNRPAIIVGGEGQVWRGSGRSIPGFDLAAALRQCGDLLVRHGGHALAAGLAVDRARIDDLRSRLNELARTSLNAEQLCPSLRLDAEVILPDVTIESLGALDRLHPTGQGNPPVHLFARNLSHERPSQRIGSDKQHLKMWVTDGSTTREALWWGGAKEACPEGRYDLAFIPEINEFNGRRSVQLKVLDWRPAQM